MNDIQSCFTYPFQDERWKEKFIVGSLMYLLSIVIPIIPMLLIYGYYAQIFRQVVAEKEPLPLPDWKRWELLLADGWKLFLIGLVYGLPVLISLFLSYGGLFIIQLSPIMDQHIDADLLLVLMLGSMFLFFILMSIGMLLAAVLGIILPAVAGQYIMTGQMRSAFNVNSWWPYFRFNIPGYLLVFVLLIGVFYIFNLVSSMLMMTFVLCCLVPIISAPLWIYMTLVAAAMHGNAYRVAAQRVNLENPVLSEAEA